MFDINVAWLLISITIQYLPKVMVLNIQSFGKLNAFVELVYRFKLTCFQELLNYGTQTFVEDDAVVDIIESSSVR